jgi:hypothetical protein
MVSEGMFDWQSALDIGRNVAVILLAVEWLVLGAIPLYLLYVITRWLRRFIPKAVTMLRLAAAKVDEWGVVIKRIMASIVAPFIWLSRTSNQVRERWAQVTGSFR